jgi:hypothetical protein
MNVFPPPLADSHSECGNDWQEKCRVATTFPAFAPENP